VQVELRDFSLQPWSTDEIVDDLGNPLQSETYRGTGTVIVQTPAFQKGAFYSLSGAHRRERGEHLRATPFSGYYFETAVV
jgi:hypothetical protein